MFGTQPGEPTQDTFLTQGPPSIAAYGPSHLSPRPVSGTDPDEVDVH